MPTGASKPLVNSLWSLTWNTRAVQWVGKGHPNLCHPISLQENVPRKPLPSF